MERMCNDVITDYVAVLQSGHFYNCIIINKNKSNLCHCHCGLVEFLYQIFQLIAEEIIQRNIVVETLNELKNLCEYTMWINHAVLILKHGNISDYHKYL